MVIHGYSWLSMVIHGYSGLFMGFVAPIYNCSKIKLFCGQEMRRHNETSFSSPLLVCIITIP